MFTVAVETHCYVPLLHVAQGQPGSLVMLLYDILPLSCLYLASLIRCLSHVLCLSYMLCWATRCAPLCSPLCGEWSRPYLYPVTDSFILIRIGKLKSCQLNRTQNYRSGNRARMLYQHYATKRDPCRSNKDVHESVDVM